LAHFDQKGFDYALGLLGQFRNAGIKTEIYPEPTKIKKQFEFATKKEIPYLGICGDQEILDGAVAIKNLATGDQESLAITEAIARLV
jgi:histidyl-tRNA synthetase